MTYDYTGLPRIASRLLGSARGLLPIANGLIRDTSRLPTIILDDSDNLNHSGLKVDYLALQVDYSGSY